MNNSSIIFDAVSKIYSSRLLYKNVNVELFPASVTLLTGNNGTGKSTLLRMAMNLSTPTTGEVRCSIPKEKCAYLGHSTFLYPHLTATENLAFWYEASLGEKPKVEHITDTLKKVNLDRFAHDPAHIFSRGMAQRLNIARILMQKPHLILLDEPSTGLDVQSRSILHDAIKNFVTQNACILWVSHDAKEDAAFATHRMHIENKTATYEKISATRNISQELQNQQSHNISQELQNQQSPQGHGTSQNQPQANPS